MTAINYYSDWTVIQFILLIAAIFGVAFLIFKVIDAIYADDTEDPVGQCIAGQQRICDKLDIEKLMAQLDERARQWNGDSKVCFNSPELMNKFLEMNPGGNFNVTVPCPPFKAPQQETEP